MSLLIGRHGQTLDAIQELARQAVGRRLDQRIRVLVDVEDYRKRREARLEEQAREARRTGARHRSRGKLEPMNALERKIVHDAVADVDGVETGSRGEDPERYVVITLLISAVGLLQGSPIGPEPVRLLLCRAS